MYLMIVLLIFFLGVWAFYESRSSTRPSRREVARILDSSKNLIHSGSLERAERELEVLIRYRLAAPKSYYLYAQVLFKSKQLEKALKFLTWAMKQFPQQYNLIHMKGRVLLALGRASEAIILMRETEGHFQSEDEFLELALAEYDAGNLDRSWALIRDLVDSSCNGRLLALAADCKFAFENYEEAIILYRKSIEQNWTSHHVLSRCGRALYQLKRYTEAEACFKDLITQDASDLSAALSLGACFERQGSFDRALMVYRQKSIWSQSDPRVFTQAGICSVETKQYDYAEQYLSQALEEGHRSPKALGYLAFCLERQKKWSAAEYTYKELLEHFPDHVAGYRGLAYLFGVGLSQELSNEQGLSMAHYALQKRADATAWELLSACEARVGNFSTAHEIQERLWSSSSDQSTRMRFKQAMRALRKKVPLDEQLVARPLVA
ncbi:MAG: hypothetical protein CMO81_04465 [Waddliaceae bacterium]|nr:hypothetical protein [Waddliaceae bacterium]